MESDRGPGVDGTAAACQRSHGNCARAARCVHFHRTESRGDQSIRGRGNTATRPALFLNNVPKSGGSYVTSLPQILGRSVPLAADRHRNLHSRVAFPETTPAGTRGIFV